MNLFAFVAFFGFALLWWVLSFPLYVDAIALGVAFLAIFVLWYSVRKIEIVCMCVSFLLAVFIAELFFSIMRDTSLTIVTEFNAHQRYSDRAGRRYQPNVDVQWSMPHGDLLGIDPLASTKIVEPRLIHFKTDSLG